jgi:radical SAM superfamily enzyme YgiQ (UPF0313 family)/Tfp pilus assembly protein PilF
MRLSLIYPPNQYSEAPPLGISYLKSFLSQNLKGIKTEIIDLNLYPKTYIDLLSGLCDYCGKRNTCRYFKLSARGINLFYKEQERCASELFCDTVGADIFLNKADDKTIRYIAKGFQDYVSLIAKSRPDIVGISLADVSQVLFGLFLAKCIKRSIDNCYLVIGGSFMNHCNAPENILKFKFVDFCIYGDGEVPLKKLLEKIGEKKNSLKNVPNLIYRKANSIIKNKKEYRKTFQELPYPVFDNMNRYQRIPVLLSFGCPHGKCTFCSYFKDGRFKQKQIDSLMNEIRYYIKTYKKNDFVFWDNSLTAEQLGLISEGLIKNRLSIDYRVMCKPSRDFNRGILKMAFESGCRMIFWGMESSNQRILNMMRKDFSFSYFKQILKISDEIGIDNKVNIIVFFPTQKEKELVSDTRFLIKNYRLLAGIKLSCFYIEAGDFIYRHLRQFRVSEIEKHRLYSHPEYTDYDLFSYYALKKHKARDNNVIFFTYCDYGTENSKISKYLLEAEYFYILRNYRRVKECLNRNLQHKASNSIFLLTGLTDKELENLGKTKRYFNPEETYRNVLRGFAKALTLRNAKTYFNNRNFPLNAKASIVNNVDFINTFLRSKFKIDCREMLLAYAYYALRQYNAAIKHANNARKILPGEIEVYLLLGSCYEETKRYNEAVEVYKKAKTFSTNNSDLYLGLGRTYYNLRQYEEAIKAANKTIELNYREGNIHLFLGFCYEKIKQYKKAIEELKKARKINPEECRLNLSLSNCYRNIGQIEQANKELERYFFGFKKSRQMSAASSENVLSPSN